MSDVLTGTPGNITTPLSATVSALTNNGSGAIRVATSAPHLFGPGDIVAMNAGPVQGQFAITVVDDTHFDLNGSTYASSYTGTVSDLSLTPQILVPTDGDTFSAQLSGLLSAFQGILDRTQYLQIEAYAALNAVASGSVSDVATWTVPVLADPTKTYLQNPGSGGPEWDAINGQWMLPSVAGSSDVQLYISYDGWDNNWRAVGTSTAIGGTPNSVSAAKDPNNTGVFYLMVTYPTSFFGLQILCYQGSWSVLYADASNGYLECQSANLNGYILFATGGTTTGTTNIVTTNNEFISQAVTNVGATVGAVNHWICRSNGSIWIAAPLDQAFATPFLYTSVDGHTLVQQTAGFGGNLVATDKITGLDYGTINGVGYWLMSVQNGAGTHGKILRSTDGINWTLGVTLGGLTNIHSLAAVGNNWVAMIKQAAPSEPQIIYSQDSINWYATNARMAQPTTADTLVRSSGIQFCASNSFGARFSQVLKPYAGPLT